MMKSYIPCLFDGMHRMATVVPRCLRRCCRHYIGAVHGEHAIYQKTTGERSRKKPKAVYFIPFPLLWSEDYRAWRLQRRILSLIYRTERMHSVSDTAEFQRC